MGRKAPDGRTGPRALGDPRAHDLDALRDVYAATDATLGGWTCDLSTDCCRPGVTGREPHLWPNEWALVERALRERPAGSRTHEGADRAAGRPAGKGPGAVGGRAAGQGGPGAGGRGRSLPLVTADEQPRSAAARAGDAPPTCELLGPDGRCTVYEVRPFGCRTFFCDRALGPTRRTPRADLQALAREIAALARAVEPHAGPIPLSRLLARRGRSRRS